MKSTFVFAITASVAFSLHLSLANRVMAQDAAPAAPAAAAEEKPAEGAADGAKLESGVVATVDGRKIMRADIDRRVVGQYSQQLAQFPANQQDFMRARVEQVALEELIDRAVLANAATADESLKPSEAAVDKRLDEMMSRLPAGADLSVALDQLGLTKDGLREEVRVELAITKLIENKMAEVKDPTAEEVKKFYDENLDFFKRGATATARHILVSTKGAVGDAALAEKKAAAEALRERLVGDEAEAFEEVAKAHSDCPSSAEGGMLGAFEKGKMVPEFEAAAFSQDVGKIGPLVQTDFGYHIILVEERSDGAVAPYSDVEETLPGYLANQRKQTAIEDYVKELRDAADVQRTF